MDPTTAAARAETFTDLLPLLRRRRWRLSFDQCQKAGRDLRAFLHLARQIGFRVKSELHPYGRIDAITGSLGYCPNLNENGVEHETGGGLCATKIPWMEHPFRLISWWEMEKFSAHQFVSIGEQLAQLSAHLAKADETGLVIECLEAILAITGRQLQAIGCRYSAEAAKRLEKKLSPELSADVVDALAAELTCAIQTEMESHLFFWVPTHRAAWYSKDAETILGQECCQRFPSAQREVESGARCFALGQYTASAFHLTRATEAGMQAIARAISFSPPNQNWNLVFRQLGTEFALKPEQRPQHWQTHGPFLETVWADLRAVSKAWRNDIAHLVDVYDEDEAKNLLAVIPLFLRDMASQMDETGKLY